MDLLASLTGSGSGSGGAGGSGGATPGVSSSASNTFGGGSSAEIWIPILGVALVVVFALVAVIKK